MPLSNLLKREQDSSNQAAFSVVRSFLQKECFCSEKKTLLSGEIIIQLAPLLNGQHICRDRRTSTEQNASRGTLFSHKLRQQGISLTRIRPFHLSSLWICLTLLSRVPQTFANGVHFCNLLGDIDIAPLNNAWIFRGSHCWASRNSSCWLTITPAWSLNRQAFKDNRRMLVKPYQIWVGPIFIPGKTGCWSVWEHRLRGNQNWKHLQQKNIQPNPSLHLFVRHQPYKQHPLGIVWDSQMGRWWNQPLPRREYSNSRYS